MRGPDEIDPARINDDQLGARPQPLLHPAGEDGMGIRRVRADHEHHITIFNRVKILRAR